MRKQCPIREAKLNAEQANLRAFASRVTCDPSVVVTAWGQVGSLDRRGDF